MALMDRSFAVGAAVGAVGKFKALDLIYWLSLVASIHQECKASDDTPGDD